MLKKLTQKLTAWDISIINWVIKHRDRRARKAFRIVTYLGSGYVWTFAYLIIFALSTDKVKAILLSVILAELLGLLIIIVSRNLVKRERPNADIGTACPSWLPFLIFIATVVSISRIYLEMHYPFDVLAGLFTGFLCARLVLFIF
jgi:membrane-associated phospholipid phosphatase